MANVNLRKLANELQAATIPIISVHAAEGATIITPPFIVSAATIEYHPLATGGQIAAGEVILAAHDPASPVYDWAGKHVQYVKLFAKMIYEYDEAVRTYVIGGPVTASAWLVTTCQTLLNIVANHSASTTVLRDFFSADRFLLLGISALDPLNPALLSDGDKRRLLQRYYEIANKGINVGEAAIDKWD